MPRAAGVYEPLGPIIVNPPHEPWGGGGTDSAPPKEALDEGAEAAYWAAVSLALLALVPGVGEVELVVGVSLELGSKLGAILAGVAAHQLDNAAQDPPQPHYQRPPKAAPRQTTVPARARSLMLPLLNSEQALRGFIDSIECSQGAFLAADPPWVQRHALSADVAYRGAGDALVAASNLLDHIAARAQADGFDVGFVPPPNTSLDAVFDAGAAYVQITPHELAQIKQRCARILSQPAPRRMQDVAATLRTLGERLLAPRLMDVRFAFPKPPV